jgi:small-conductance mechanosensitive channel
MRPNPTARAWPALLAWLAPAWLPLVWLALAGPALAQPQPAPTVTPQQAQQALEILRDPQRRAEILSVLETLARAAPGGAGASRPAVVPSQPAPGPRPAAAPVEETSAADSGPATPPGAAPAPAAAPASTPAPAAPDAAPLAPDSLGAQVLMGLSDRLATLSEDIVMAVQTVISFPLIVLWLVQLAGDPGRQGLMLDTLWRLALVMGTGLAAEWLVARALRPLYRRLAERVPAGPVPSAAEEVEEGADAARPATRLQDEALQSARIWGRARRLGGWLRRVPFGVAALALDLLPMLAVLATGYILVGGVFGDQATPRLVILAAINAYVVYRLLNGMVGMLVAPREARMRLLPVSDEVAAYVARWARRGTAVGIFGYATIEAGLLFGLYRLAHDALVKLLFLALAGFVVAIILQQRAAVAARIRPPEESEGLFPRARAMLAPVWHVIAVIYVAALWFVLALEVPRGFIRLLMVSVQTAAVLGLARVALILALGGLHRLLNAQADEPEAERRIGVAGRLATYEPILRAVLRVVVVTLAVAGLLEAWGLPVAGWFLRAELGARLLRTLGSVALTIALAVGVWEIANLAIERHLAGLAASAQAARSARLRTLLPMFRSALLVAICVFVGLIVLSEIGINIAPLLAGAGVFGVALAFGSQRLVQDVITGLFLLLENTMQVGDVVTLGGMSGTVENLSIRTIRLRAMDGSMHIVPFSAVTTVTNQTRDFGYAVVDVSLSLNEDPERIGGILREVAAEMRAEDKWATAISADLEVLGIDRFIDNALVLRIRIRTTPGQRWAVGRELNRRIKQRFDATGVQSPMTSHRALSPPHQVDESSG